MCDQAGGAPYCDGTKQCVVHAGFLGARGHEVGGVCE
jgi:hypothetical protein